MLRAALAGTAATLAATAALAHPGHPAGGYLLAEPLHAALGSHWAVIEPLLMLAAVVAASRAAGWALSRVARWARSPRSAS